MAHGHQMARIEIPRSQCVRTIRLFIIITTIITNIIIIIITRPPWHTAQV